MVICEKCGEDLDNLTALGVHRKKRHPGSLPICVNCKTTFQNRAALCRHRRSCKGPDNACDINDASTIVCGHCYETFRDIQTLCGHLEDSHDEPAIIETSTFANEADFESWIKRVENEGKFKFVRSNRRCTKTATVKYFRCHRSGLQESASLGVRAPKKAGSIKANFTCSTFVVASIMKESGSVAVKFCIHHYNHDNSPCQVRKRACANLTKNTAENENGDKVSSIDSIPDTLVHPDLESTSSKITFSERKERLRNALESIYLAFEKTDENAEEVHKEVIERVENVAAFVQRHSRTDLPSTSISSLGASELTVTHSPRIHRKKRRL